MLQTIGKCFIQEGDEVLIPSATYTLYKEISKVMGATVIDVPMAQEGVDLTALQKQVGPRTKLIWIANPNNPTGTLVDKDELGKTAGYAAGNTPGWFWMRHMPSLPMPACSPTAFLS